MIRAGGSEMKYEKIAVDEWVLGVIDDVLCDPAHEFTLKGEKKTGPAIRFVFKLDGYQYPKKSRWMTPYTTENSNLYKLFLKPLCPNFDPKNKEVDLERLKGLQVKLMFANDGDYQNITQIRPLEQNLNLILSGKDVEPTEQEISDVPF